MAASGRFALWPCQKQQSLAQLKIITHLVIYAYYHNIRTVNMLTIFQRVSMCLNPGLVSGQNPGSNLVIRYCYKKQEGFCAYMYN